MSSAIRFCTTKISCFKKIYLSKNFNRNQTSHHLRKSKLKSKLNFPRNLRSGHLVLDCLIQIFRHLFNLSDTKKRKKKKKLMRKNSWTKLKKEASNS